MEQKGIKQIAHDFVDVLKKSFSYFTDYDKVKEYIDGCEEESFGSQVSSSLFSHTSSILDIVNSERVPSNTQVKFIEKVSLFGDTLHLKSFKSENRKTKKVIIKHLSNLLAASFKYAEASILNSSFDKLLKGSGVDETQIPKGLNPMELMNDSKLMNMFSENSELSSIINKMTTKLLDSKVDPMQLLGSIMTGNTQTGVLKDLFSDIEADIKEMDPTKLNEITNGIDNIISKK
jgi:hypothetical protein